jgi:hypothetical protein
MWFDSPVLEIPLRFAKIFMVFASSCLACSIAEGSDKCSTLIKNSIFIVNKFSPGSGSVRANFDYSIQGKIDVISISDLKKNTINIGKKLGKIRKAETQLTQREFWLPL